MLPDRLGRLAKEAHRHTFGQDNVVDRLKRHGVATDDLLRKDVEESTVGIEHIDLHVGDLVCPAVLWRDE